MQPVNLSKTGQYAIMQLSEPYTNVESIRTFTDDLSGIGTLIKQFRWSTDGKIWSYWIELTQENLISLSLGPSNNFYIEYKYQLSTQGNITIINVQIEPVFKITDPNAKIVFPTLACNECSVDRASILTTCDSTFNPYAVNPAVNLYKSLSSSVQDMFGLGVYYLKSTPKENSGDVIFKEWTLYNVEEPVCTKVMVNNNEFPSNDTQYDMFGLGYEQPFEIEIVKENYERDFGLDAAPQKGDILFFHINNDHLYEIQSSSPVKGFMMEITSWKCELTIYKPKTNRDLPTTVHEIMDDILNSSDELFGETMKEETEDLAKPQQFNTSIGTTNQDPVRSYINQYMKIHNYELTNHGTTIADHFYDLSSVFDPTKTIVGVKYNAVSNFNETQNFAFTSWAKFVKPKYAIPTDPCKITSLQGNTITITMNSSRNFQVGSIVNIFRQGRLNFYGTVAAQITPTSYTVTLTDEMLQFLNRLSSAWSTAPGFSIKLAFKNTLINGHGLLGSPDNYKGWKIEAIANRYFVFTENNNETLISLPENLSDDKWYGVVMNYAAGFKQINFVVWEIDPSKRSNNTLKKVFSQTINTIVPENKDFCGNFYITGSNMHQTNIRIFKEIIPEEHQSTILNQYVVGDSHEAIVIDNAMPIMQIPFVGETK